MKMYKVLPYLNKIEEVEVTRKSKHFVTVRSKLWGEIRAARTSYFLAWEDARSWHVQRLERERDSLVAQLERIEMELSEARELVPPASPAAPSLPPGGTDELPPACVSTPKKEG